MQCYPWGKRDKDKDKLKGNCVKQEGEKVTKLTQTVPISF